MANATPFMRYFGRHLPGNPNVVPSFMPGAGGAVGMNYLQSVASRDGLTIATPLAPVVLGAGDRREVRQIRHCENELDRADRGRDPGPLCARQRRCAQHSMTSRPRKS